MLSTEMDGKQPDLAPKESGDQNGAITPQNRTNDPISQGRSDIIPSNTTKIYEYPPTGDPQISSSPAGAASMSNPSSSLLSTASITTPSFPSKAKGETPMIPRGVHLDTPHKVLSGSLGGYHALGPAGRVIGDNVTSARIPSPRLPSPLQGSNAPHKQLVGTDVGSSDVPSGIYDNAVSACDGSSESGGSSHAKGARVSQSTSHSSHLAQPPSHHHKSHADRRQSVIDDGYVWEERETDRTTAAGDGSGYLYDPNEDLYIDPGDAMRRPTLMVPPVPVPVPHLRHDLEPHPQSYAYGDGSAMYPQQYGHVARDTRMLMPGFGSQVPWRGSAGERSGHPFVPPEYAGQYAEPFPPVLERYSAYPMSYGVPQGIPIAGHLGGHLQSYPVFPSHHAVARGQGPPAFPGSSEGTSHFWALNSSPRAQHSSVHHRESMYPAQEPVMWYSRAQTFNPRQTWNPTIGPPMQPSQGFSWSFADDATTGTKRGRPKDALASPDEDQEAAQALLDTRHEHRSRAGSAISPSHLVPGGSRSQSHWGDWNADTGGHVTVQAAKRQRPLPPMDADSGGVAAADDDSLRGKVGGALRLHKRVAFGGHGTSRQWQPGMSKYLGVVQGVGHNRHYWYVTAQKGTGRRFSSRFESLSKAEAYLLKKFRVLGIDPASKIRPGWPGDPSELAHADGPSLSAGVTVNSVVQSDGDASDAESYSSRTDAGFDDAE